MRDGQSAVASAVLWQRRQLPSLEGAFRGLLLYEEGQAVQSANWRRGCDKRGEKRTLGLHRALSGSSKRADADQRLQRRRTEGVGDAAQPLQQHRDAPLMNLLQMFTTLGLEPSEVMMVYLTRAEYVSRQIKLVGEKSSKER